MRNKNQPLTCISEFVDDILDDIKSMDNVRQSDWFSNEEQELDVSEMQFYEPFIVDHSPFRHRHVLRATPTREHMDEGVSPFSPVDECCDKPVRFNEKFQKLEERIIPEMLRSIDFYYEEFKTLSLWASYFTDFNEKRKIAGLLNKLKEYRPKDKANHKEAFQALLTKWKDDISSPNICLQGKHSFPSMGLFQKSESLYVKKILELYVYQLLLEKAYIFYLNLPNDAVTRKLFEQGFTLYVLMRFQNDLSMMELISALGLPIAVEYANDYSTFIENHPHSIRQALSDQAGAQNAKRLALGRIRRFYLSLNALLNQGNMSWLMLWWEPSFRWVMSWLNFMFFLPRIAIALEDICTHTFLLGQHTEHEKGLCMEVRFWMVFSRRWEILIRDTAWMLNGLFALFVLTGALGFWSLYLNAFIQLLEVFLNIYLLSRFEEQQKFILGNFDRSDDLSIKSYHGFLQDQHSRTALEYENRVVRLFNSVMILIGSVMILPTMASISPIIPLVGACLALSISAFHFLYFPDWDERRRAKLDPFMISNDNGSMNSVSTEDMWNFIGIFLPQSAENSASKHMGESKDRNSSYGTLHTAF